jgi:hypothetical protein
MSDQSGKKMNYLIVAVLIAVWGFVGVLDQPNVPFSGYFTDGDNTITQVFEGSPAEAAGLQVGDYIRSVGGIAVEDSRAMAERPRPDIGETRTLVVERDGESVSVDLTYAQLNRTGSTLAYVSALIGFCFLIFGMLPFMKDQGRNNRLLALTGMAFAMVFFAGPYFRSYGLRTALASLTLVVAILGFAFLMDLMVSYPKPKAWTEGGWAKRAIYGPAALVALVIVYVIVMNPAATSGLNVAISIMFGVFIVYYFGSAIWAMFGSYRAASPAERSSQGLTMMLVGILVGLLPVTLASLVGIFSPQTVLPGSNFYFVTLILIPITLWMALSRSSESAPVPAVAPPPPPPPMAPPEPTPPPPATEPTPTPEEPAGESGEEASGETEESGGPSY